MLTGKVPVLVFSERDLRRPEWVDTCLPVESGAEKATDGKSGTGFIIDGSDTKRIRTEKRHPTRIEEGIPPWCEERRVP